MSSLNAHEGQFVWSVEAWGSKPGTDDDCWQGADFATEAEARTFMADPDFGADTGDTAWLRLVTGTYTAGHEIVTREGNKTLWNLIDVTVIQETPCPGYDAKARKAGDEAFEASWAQERAMQAGMMGGCDAYNDAIGSPLGGYEDCGRCRGGGCAYCEPQVFI